MPAILRPRALTPGDTVAVVALSSGWEPDVAQALVRGVAELEAMGFAVRVAPLVGRGHQWWWAAARPEELAEEFNRQLRDPQVRAIVALSGGRMTSAYLDLIDLDAIRADPKPILGFSDVSALLLWVHARTGLVAIHGDDAAYGFGVRDELEPPLRGELAEVYRNVLTGAAPIPLPAIASWECWRPGRAEGPLVGAMLNRIIRVQASGGGLPLEAFDGALLFWEDLGVATSGVWMDLQTLRVAGVFDRIAGMIVGPTGMIEVAEEGPSLREVVLEALGDRDIPVLGNVDIGHAPPNVPLPLGVRAALDADALTLTLLEPAVASA